MITNEDSYSDELRFETDCTKPRWHYLLEWAAAREFEYEMPDDQGHINLNTPYYRMYLI